MADALGSGASRGSSATARLSGVRPPSVRPPSPIGVSTAEADQAAAAEAAAKAKKKKRTKVIIICVVLLLVGYEVKGKVVKPHFGPGEKVPAGAIISLGSITTNLSDGHLAQIGVSMQMTAAANAKKEAMVQSELVGATVAILGQQTYNGLLPAGGRSALRGELLRAYQQTLGVNEGAQQVSAVYFTSFVLQ